VNGEHVTIQLDRTDHRMIDNLAFSAVVANAGVAPDFGRGLGRNGRLPSRDGSACPA